jgi:hypothetical protein
MTKVLVEGFGWVYIVLVLDWYTKKEGVPELLIPCQMRRPNA